MTDLRIRITESDGIRYAGKIEGDYASTLYIGENIPETLDAILEGLQNFRDIPAMVRALHFCPEFCQLAAAVHGLHLAESDETPVDEAIAILTKLRDSQQPEAIRTRAGNLLIDIAKDGRAVCDASSVDERPGQDAGAALVGVECYFSDDGKNWGDPSLVEEFVPKGGFPSWLKRSPHPVDAYAETNGCWYEHARPVYLGLPEPTP